MITIEDLSKLSLMIGEVRETSDNNIKILCGDKEFSTKQKLNVKKGDMILISISDNKLKIPLIKGDMPIIPEKKIDSGSKVQ